MRTAIPLRVRVTVLAAPHTGRHARHRKYPARRPGAFPPSPDNSSFPRKTNGHAMAAIMRQQFSRRPAITPERPP